MISMPPIQQSTQCVGNLFDLLLIHLKTLQRQQWIDSTTCYILNAATWIAFDDVEQVLLVLASSGMVWVTTSYRAQKKGLPFIHQAINWFLAGFSMLLPLKSPRGILPRLLSIFLGFAPLFLLLSIGYCSLWHLEKFNVLPTFILQDLYFEFWCSFL